MKTITGSCLCNTITFEVADDFDNFQLCHCTQCQKTTGSAHASNLFTSPSNITWHTGKEEINRFDLEGRRISNAFCGKCGSRLPFLSLSGEILVVPAGSLDEKPTKPPQGNIFWTERAGWYDEAIQAQHYDDYIE